MNNLKTYKKKRREYLMCVLVKIETPNIQTSYWKICRMDILLQTGEIYNTSHYINSLLGHKVYLCFDYRHIHDYNFTEQQSKNLYQWNDYIFIKDFVISCLNIIIIIIK